MLIAAHRHLVFATEAALLFDTFGENINRPIPLRRTDHASLRRWRPLWQLNTLQSVKIAAVEPPQLAHVWIDMTDHVV